MTVKNNEFAIQELKNKIDGMQKQFDEQFDDLDKYVHNQLMTQDRQSTASWRVLNSLLKLMPFYRVAYWRFNRKTKKASKK